MALPQAVHLAAGTLAVLATVAVLVIQIVLSGVFAGEYAVRAAAVVSACLEAVTLVVIGWLFAAHVFAAGNWPRSRRRRNVELASGVAASLLAAVATVVTVVALGRPRTGPADDSDDTARFLVGCSVALGVSLACQLIFLVLYFLVSRAPARGAAAAARSTFSFHLDLESGRRPALNHVKSIPYAKTLPTIEISTRTDSTDSLPPPPTFGRRSRSGTVSSIRSSLSQVVRPISSRTHLLAAMPVTTTTTTTMTTTPPTSTSTPTATTTTSTATERTVRRAISLDSTLRLQTKPEDGFDTWDTSSVDPDNRQAVMESSCEPFPHPRFLEPIPAGPVGGCCSGDGGGGCSGGTTAGSGELEVPKMRTRSRSYTGSRSRSPSASPGDSPPPPPPLTLHAGGSEAHIHPLFRSDSPVPPPAATPGTVVTAAPDAGKVISDRQSIRSLRRMRSGSMPANSPLLNQYSFDDLASLRRRTGEGSSLASNRTGEDSPPLPSPGERKMTPPIPDWILSAGARTSLSGYHSRRAPVPGAAGTGGTG